MIIPLPGGAQIDTGENASIVSADNGTITLHTPLALSRLIERWKNQPNQNGLLSTYTDQLQTLENVIWDTVIKRFLSFAADAALDSLGLLVGEPRAGLSDPQYRVRISVRILVNQSFGTPAQIIAIMRAAEPAAFQYFEFPTTIVIEYTAPTAVSPIILSAIANEARPAGVRLILIAQAQADSFLLGDDTPGGTLDSVHGLSSEALADGGYMGGDY